MIKKFFNILNIFSILCIIFFCTNIISYTIISDIIYNDKFIHNKSYSKKEKNINKKGDFYINTKTSKIYFDNSKICMNGIKEIGEKILNLIKGNYNNLLTKNILINGIKDINKLDDKIDFYGFSSISLGYYIKNNIQIDFETMYSWANIISNNPIIIFDKTISILGFLLNFYFNHNIKNTKLSPYIGLGIGPAIFNLKKINKLEKDLTPLVVPWFAYQIKFGIDYLVISKVEASIGYRYFRIPIPVINDISIHNIEAGLKFSF